MYGSTDLNLLMTSRGGRAAVVLEGNGNHPGLSARLVRRGEGYGRNNACTAKRAMLEFWWEPPDVVAFEKRFAAAVVAGDHSVLDEDGPDAKGQFVGRYHLSTLVDGEGDDGHFTRTGVLLDVNSGWSVSVAELVKLVVWALNLV